MKLHGVELGGGAVRLVEDALCDAPVFFVVRKTYRTLMIACLTARLVTSQGPPYPSRSPRAHPSGWTRTQGLSRTEASITHARFSF